MLASIFLNESAHIITPSSRLHGQEGGSASGEKIVVSDPTKSCVQLCALDLGFGQPVARLSPRFHSVQRGERRRDRALLAPLACMCSAHADSRHCTARHSGRQQTTTSALSREVEVQMRSHVFGVADIDFDPSARLGRWVHVPVCCLYCMHTTSKRRIACSADLRAQVHCTHRGP